jgi:hypothetical protein
MMYMRLQFVLMQPTSPATDRPSQTRSKSQTWTDQASERQSFDQREMASRSLMARMTGTVTA